MTTEKELGEALKRGDSTIEVELKLKDKATSAGRPGVSGYAISN